jgi:tetratricopeptide (TPR) repeat protein
MKKVLSLVAGLALASGLWAQPKPKSKGEYDAIMAIQTATTPDAQLAAVENLLTKYADTEFKPMVLQMAVQAAQQGGDHEKMMVYGERALQADPKNFMVMLMMAQSIAQRTREFDLDKEEKLKQAEKYANDGIAALKTAPKPRPDIPDDQWVAAKKDFEAQGYEALGIAALVRKKYDDATTQFKKAMETQATPDPATKVRLASAYNGAGNYDAAIQLLDTVLADQQLHATIRQVAGQEKLKAVTAKAAKK